MWEEPSQQLLYCPHYVFLKNVEPQHLKSKPGLPRPPRQQLWLWSKQHVPLACHRLQQGRQETQPGYSPGLGQFQLLWLLTLQHCLLLSTRSAATYLWGLGLHKLAQTFPFHSNSSFSYSMCCMTASSLKLFLNPNKPPSPFPEIAVFHSTDSRVFLQYAFKVE